MAAASVDERAIDGETPAELVERLALAKAATVAARSVDVGPGRAGGGPVPGDRIVVGADTVIDLDGEILGKPIDRADAATMLRSLSGRRHHVITGMAVVGRLGRRCVEASTVERTAVTMRSLGDDDIDWYLGTGEFAGKAGSYAIQGYGALLVEGIEGSYHNVVGLSVAGLDALLRGVGLPLRALASP